MVTMEDRIQAVSCQGKSEITIQRWQCKIRSGQFCCPPRHRQLPLDNQLEEDGGYLKTLEGYFDNLDSAAVNEKGVLQKLVLNNTTISTSNESLVALVKKLSNDIKNLEREISRMKKGGQVSARNTTLCDKCKKEVFH